MSLYKSDPTSIGAILLSMGAITCNQLDETIAEQLRLHEDALLGKLLVAAGYCSNKQLEIAIAAQQTLRNGDKTKKALALADLSIARRRRNSIVLQRGRIIDKGHRFTAVAQSITSQDHVAITPHMLAKGDE